MPKAMQSAFDALIELTEESACEGVGDAAATDGLRVVVHEDMGAVEQEWRAFEQVADGTVFQSFDWLSTWQRHVGTLRGILPAVITAYDSHGTLQFLLPLAVDPGGLARRLTWLGSELCDYNGPLLGPDFGKHFDAVQFQAVWTRILLRLRDHPRLGFDAICLDKMQRAVGTQSNPFVPLGVIPHPDGAYLTRLGCDWDKFYTQKRSSNTRQRDRAKRKKMSERGEVRFVTAQTSDDQAATLHTLMEQKAMAMAAMGVANIFERPGYAAFYHALAAKSDIIHISRLDVGSEIAAANLGLVFRGRYYHVLASYTDGDLSRFGPGAAHLRELLQYAIGRGCEVFDFTIGDERYKQEWCDTTIVLFDHVSAVTLRGCALALGLYVIRRIKRWIKQSPLLWSAAFRLRGRIGPIMRRPRS